MYKSSGGQKLNPQDLKSIFEPLSNLNDGKHKIGSGKAKEQAKQFINNGQHKINNDKKSKTNTP